MICHGKCMCGAIEFTLNAPQKTASACHCSQCRKWSGHYWASINGPIDGFEITKGGEKISWYQASGYARRGFCNSCGSALFWHGFGLENFAKLISVGAGTIEDTKDIRLGRHIFCESKGGYYELKDGVPIYDKWPGA